MKECFRPKLDIEWLFCDILKLIFNWSCLSLTFGRRDPYEFSLTKVPKDGTIGWYAWHSTNIYGEMTKPYISKTKRCVTAEYAFSIEQQRLNYENQVFAFQRWGAGRGKEWAGDGKQSKSPILSKKSILFKSKLKTLLHTWHLKHRLNNSF